MVNKSLLHKFFDGQASFNEEKAIRDWFEESKENEISFFQERKLYDIILFNKNIIADGSAKGKRKNTFIWNIFIHVAAILLLIIVAGLLINNNFENKRKPDQLNTLIVPPGQRINLVLSDNSSIWLNSNTIFRYPSKFSKKQKEVYLDGEAYFEVSSDKKNPFIINTTQGKVKVTGTKFNLSAYSKYDKFETSLFSGEVSIELNSTPEETIKISPTQKATASNGSLLVAKIDDYDEFLWRKGLIAFNNKQLDDILFVLEQYFDIKIQIDDTALSKNTYTGKFRQADGIDYALRVLQKSIHFTYERDNEEQIIYIKN